MDLELRLRGTRESGKKDGINCHREGGQTIQEAFAVTKPSDTGPKLFESIE
jgi:hypothetical protein